MIPLRVGKQRRTGGSGLRGDKAEGKKEGGSERSEEEVQLEREAAEAVLKGKNLVVLKVPPSLMVLVSEE